MDSSALQWTKLINKGSSRVQADFWSGQKKTRMPSNIFAGGNSFDATLRANYRELATKEEGEAWFLLTPESCGVKIATQKKAPIYAETNGSTYQMFPSA